MTDPNAALETGGQRKLLDQARMAFQQRRLEVAYQLCEAILARDPAQAEALFLMGRTVQEVGDIPAAIDLLGQAATLDQRLAEPAIYLARALEQAGRTVRAREVALMGLQRAEAAQKKHTPSGLALDTLGVVLGRVGEHARAIDAAKHAVAKEPARAAFWRNLGWAELHQRGAANAKKAFQKAMALDPNDHMAPAALVDLDPQTAASNLVAKLERLFMASADPDRRLLLGHALAKSFEDLGQPQDAFDWLVRAKAAKRTAIRYDPARDRALFEAAVLTGPAQAGASSLDGSPVFVIGLPRSGTTLVDRIISSHPDIISVGEPNTLQHILRDLTQVKSGGAWLEPAMLAQAASLDPQALGAAYLDATGPLAGGAARWLDKTPDNYLMAGLIHRALPNARIVCLRRHPLDSILSLYRQSFGPQTAYRFTYGLEDVARYYVQFDRLVAHWRSTLPSDRFCEVRYEDLVTDLEPEARRLFAFCGLAWTDAALRPHENVAAVDTASAAQVRRPVHSNSVGRWRAYGERLAPAIRILAEAGLPLEP